MKIILNVVFWTVAAVLVLPAIVGIVAGIAVVAVVAMVAFAVCLAALGVMCIACVPIVWWCATVEGAATQALLARVRAQNQQIPAN